MPRFACVFVTAIVLLSACSKADHESGRAVTSVDVREEAGGAARDAAAVAPPNISPDSAPGVAFNYRYAFVLPSKSIAVVQEQHAAACEKLGTARCRIAGMHYTLIDEDRVSGQLTFKLAPDLARAFGKEGITAVEKAEGKLVDAAIEGTDVGIQITASQRRSADAQAELARIEQRLAAGGVSGPERAELQAQAERLRQQLAGERETRSEGEEQLANTPMVFDYRGNEGYTLGSHPFSDAADSAWASLTTMISLVLLAIGVALPWLFLLALLLALWRSPPGLWLRRKLHGSGRPLQEVVPATPPPS